MCGVRLKFISMNQHTFLTRTTSLPAIASAPWLFACSPAQPLTVGIHHWMGYETARKDRLNGAEKTISTFLFNTGLLEQENSLHGLVCWQWLQNSAN